MTKNYLVIYYLWDSSSIFLTYTWLASTCPLFVGYPLMAVSTGCIGDVICGDHLSRKSHKCDRWNYAVCCRFRWGIQNGIALVDQLQCAQHVLITNRVIPYIHGITVCNFSKINICNCTYETVPSHNEFLCPPQYKKLSMDRRNSLA